MSNQRPSKPQVLESQDNDYKARIEAAKKASAPRGGKAELEGTPRFDQAPVSVQDEAGRARLRAAMGDGQQKSSERGELLSSEERRQLAERGKLIPGIGSGVRANQPHGSSVSPQAAETNRPVVPRHGEVGIRKETAEQVSNLVASMQKEADEEESQIASEEKKAQEEANLSGDTLNPLASRRRKKEIEARCAPISLEDLVTDGEVRQTVPIVPGILEPTFKSTTGDEDLFVKKMASFEDEPDKDGVRRVINEELYTNRYLMDRFLLMNLTVALYSLNGTKFPSHLDSSLNPSEEAFWFKYKRIRKLPTQILSDLMVNYSWFSERLSKLTLSKEALDQLQGF